MLIKKINKLTALLTGIFYLTTSSGFAQPAASLTVLPPTSPEINADREIIRIPENLGSIQVQHQSGKDSPLIIFIQDAHSVVDAQNHIQEIIRHFQQTYGIRVIALEGASGEIDPTLFRTFPDSFIKQRVLTDYVKRGELTGAEMAAALNPSAGAYYGLEDWNLYQEHYLAYLRAVEKKETVLKSLTGIRKALDAKRAKVYSTKFDEFHDKLRAFENASTYLLELLTYLASLEGAKQKIAQYPDLEKLYRSFEFEKETEGKSANIESSVRQMADRFKAKYLKQMNIKQEMMFHRSYQSFVTGQMETGAFLKYLVETGESFGVKARLTPAMLKLLGHSETLETIKGTKLFDELQNFTREIEDTLIAIPEEREIADKYRQLTLLKDLVNLELTREQLEQYEKTPEAYLSLLLESGDKSSHPERSEGSQVRDSSAFGLRMTNAESFHTMNEALEFYRLALERDKAFSRNLAKLLKDEKAKAAIVVAGGFHTEGFERNLKEQGYSYSVITPKIQSLEGQEMYAEVMQGKLSYGPQFKTTFYDAFIRHSSAKLMNEFNEMDFRKNIKLWRDEIIRKLSAEGRMTEAGEYLRYLDLLFKVYNEKFGGGTRIAKSKEETLKAIENELTQFKKETLSDLWRRFDFQLKEFSTGLKSLVDRKELSAQNISLLLDRVGQVRPSTLGAPLALAQGGFDSQDLIAWGNTGMLPEQGSNRKISHFRERTKVRLENRVKRSNAQETRSGYFERREAILQNETAQAFHKKLLKRLAIAGALESATFWLDFPKEEKPDILKIEVGKIPVKAIKVNPEQYVPRSETRAPPAYKTVIARSEIRTKATIPTASEVYQNVIQTDEFLSSLTLAQVRTESKKIDSLLEQERSNVIPYIGNHLTDKGRAVQLVLEKVMDRLMKDAKLDNRRGHINFARISLYPATYKQIGGDTLANRFKALMLEAFNSGSYFAGASAYADGPQLVILDVPIRDFRKNYPKLWNRKLNQLIKEFPEIKGHRLLKSLRTKHYAAYSVIRLPGERHEVPPQELKVPVNEEKRREKYTTEGKDRELIPILVEDEYAWDYRKWLRAKLKEARLNLKNEREKRAEFEKRGRKALAEKTKERIKKAYEQVGYFAQRVTLAADMESVARVEAVEKMPDALKRKLGVSQWLLTATNIKKVRGYLREKNDFKMLGEFYKAFILGRDRLVPPGEYPSGKIPRLRHMIHQLEFEDSLYSIRNVQKTWREFLKIPNANEDHLRKFQSFYLKYQLTRNEMVIRADRDVRMPGMEIRTVDSGTVETVYTPRFVYKEAFLNGIYQAARNGSLGKFKRHLAATGQRPLSETISETLIIGKRSIGDEFYGAVLVKSKDGKALRWLPFGGEYDGFNAWNKQYPPDKEDHMDEVFHRGVEFALRDERARRVANGRASLKEVLDFLQAWTDNMRKPGNASKLFVRTVKFYPPGKAEGGADFERPTLYKKRGSDINIGPLFAKSNGGNYRRVDPLSWKVGDEVPEYEMPDRTEPVKTQISATFTVDEEPLREGESLMQRISDNLKPDSLEKWNDLQKKLHGEGGLSGKAATVKQVEEMARDRDLPLPLAGRSEVRSNTEAEQFAVNAIEEGQLTLELKNLADGLSLNGPFDLDHILIAEDLDFLQRLYRRGFEQLLGIPTIVSDGNQALTAMQESTVSLVISDITMPVLRGDALFAQVRKSEKEENRLSVPFIFISSDPADLPPLNNFVRLGKPFNPVHIAHMVKYLMLKSQAKTNPPVQAEINPVELRYQLEYTDDAPSVFKKYVTVRESGNDQKAKQLESLMEKFMETALTDPDAYPGPGKESNLYKSGNWVKNQIIIYELERGEQVIPDEEIQRMLEVLNKSDVVLKWYKDQWDRFSQNGRNGKAGSDTTIHFDQLIDGFIEKASRPDYEGPRQEGQPPNLLPAARYVKDEIQKIKIQSGYFLFNGVFQEKTHRAEVRNKDDSKDRSSKWMKVLVSGTGFDKSDAVKRLIESVKRNQSQNLSLNLQIPPSHAQTIVNALMDVLESEDISVGVFNNDLREDVKKALILLDQDPLFRPAMENTSETVEKIVIKLRLRHPKIREIYHDLIFFLSNMKSLQTPFMNQMPVLVKLISDRDEEVRLVVADVLLTLVRNQAREFDLKLKEIHYPLSSLIKDLMQNIPGTHTWEGFEMITLLQVLAELENFDQAFKEANGFPRLLEDLSSKEMEERKSALYILDRLRKRTPIQKFLAEQYLPLLKEELVQKRKVALRTLQDLAWKPEFKKILVSKLGETNVAEYLKLAEKILRAEVRSTSPGDEAEKLPETEPVKEIKAAVEAVKAQIKRDRSIEVDEIRDSVLSDHRMDALFKISENAEAGEDIQSQVLKVIAEFERALAIPIENFPGFFAEKIKISDKTVQTIAEGLTFKNVVNRFFWSALELGRQKSLRSNRWTIVRGYLINKDPEGDLMQKEDRWQQMRLSEAAAAIAKLDLAGTKVSPTRIDQAVAKHLLEHLETQQVQTLIDVDAGILKNEPLEKILKSLVEDIIRNPPGPDSSDFLVNDGGAADRSEIRKNVRIDLDAIDLNGFFKGKEKEIETLVTQGKGNAPSIDSYLRSEIRKGMGRDIGGTLGRVNARILKRFKQKSTEFPLEVIKESFEQEGVELAEEKVQRLQKKIAFAANKPARPAWFDQDSLSFVSANRVPNTERILSVDQALSQLLSEIMPKNQMNTLGSDIPELGLTPAEMGDALSPLADKVNRFYAVYEKVAIRQKDFPFTNLSFIKVSGDPAKKLSEIMERESSVSESPLLFTAVGGMDLSQLDDRLRQNVVELPVAQTDMPLILKQRAIRWGAELLMIRGELLKQNPDFLKPEVFKNYLEKYHPALASLAQSFSVHNGFLRAEVSALVEQFTTEKLLSTQA